MGVIKTNLQPLYGQWKSGYALDLHTTSSTPIGEDQHGHMQFETVRPPIAELLYQLKYRGNLSAASDIIETAVSFLRPHLQKFSLIVPVPPSSQREIQPVLVLSEGIGAALGVPVMACVTTTRPTTQLKGVDDPEERKKLCDGLYAVDVNLTRKKDVLLFDDLFRSGSTLNAITEVLLNQGEVSSVRVLTVTKTRSNR